MNPTTAQAFLADIGSDGLWRTNPVRCLDELVTRWQSTVTGRMLAPERLRHLLETLAEHGVHLPAAAFARWSSAGLLPGVTPDSLTNGDPAPGVLGLAVDGDGYILPLRPLSTSGEWRIDGDLPFTSEQVQDGLAGLLRESGVPAHDSVPERFAFTFENPLCRRIRGDSMTVAAVLAVLRQLGGESSPLLRAAVSLVEPRPGGSLGAVSDISTKMDAAYRECGRLSLALALPGTDVDRDRVETVWEVESVADLGRRLGAAGLLAPILAARGGAQPVRGSARTRPAPLAVQPSTSLP